MAADDQRMRALPVLLREPRPEARRCVLAAALFAKLHSPVFGAEAQPRERIDDRAQAVVAGEIRVVTECTESEPSTFSL